jgi:hypothetical protein
MTDTYAGTFTEAGTLSAWQQLSVHAIATTTADALAKGLQPLRQQQQQQQQQLISWQCKLHISVWQGLKTDL